MNMFARFDENPAMTLQDIKKKTLRTDTRTHAGTDNVKTVYPPQTKFAGGIKKKSFPIHTVIWRPDTLTHSLMCFLIKTKQIHLF